ncbi:MAG: MFS transporter [Burkholderiaceae bacterium]
MSAQTSSAAPARDASAAPSAPTTPPPSAPAKPPPVPRRVLPVIVLAQLCGASLWFAGNAILPTLELRWSLTPAQMGLLLGGVNTGFIAGTLVYALLLIADRFRARFVFLTSAAIAAAVNVGLPMAFDNFEAMLASRLLVGFFLAGIYPVGMRVATDWYRHGLGAALGLLVGALVFATGLPHAVRAAGLGLPAMTVLGWLSVLALGGGLAMALLVPDPPARPAAARGIDVRALTVIWRDRRVRASAFGYFGHMWELYAMLSFTPLIIGTYLHTGITAGVSLFSFIVIAVGSLGCIVGGLLAKRVGSARVAVAQLAVSGICCLLVPWMMDAPWWLFALWLLLWGITVSGDSPQFSTLTALNSPPAVVGSVLTLVNCIGFAISVGSIQWVAWRLEQGQLATVLPWLGIGPVVGLVAMRPLLRAGAARAGG